MYTLYDPTFTVEYTDQDEVIVYANGQEVAQEIIPGIEKEQILFDKAIELLSQVYPPHNYISAQEAANMFGLLRGSIHYLMEKHMVINYHYVVIGKGKFLTPEGIKAIERNKEKND